MPRKRKFKVGDFWRFTAEGEPPETIWKSRILSKITNFNGENRWIFIHYPGNVTLDFSESWLFMVDDFGNMVVEEDYNGHIYKIIKKAKHPVWVTQQELQGVKNDTRKK